MIFMLDDNYGPSKSPFTWKGSQPVKTDGIAVDIH
jgi:hypothetical protein